MESIVEVTVEEFILRQAALHGERPFREGLSDLGYFGSSPFLPGVSFFLELREVGQADPATFFSLDQVEVALYSSDLGVFDEYVDNPKVNFLYFVVGCLLELGEDEVIQVYFVPRVHESRPAESTNRH